MKRFLAVILVLLSGFTQICANATALDVNIPTTDKNWFDAYESFYDTSSLPKTAPSAIGLRSFSSNSSYDYKQEGNRFRSIANSFYVNSFKEIFEPAEQRVFNNLIGENTDEAKAEIRKEQTGVAAFDSYVVDEYEGLSEEELKWLLNHNIISRDPEFISIHPDSVEVGETESLFHRNINEEMFKSEFLVALHKATYGILESRPIVFDMNANRKASKITWEKKYDEDGNLEGYDMIVGEFKDQSVEISKSENSDIIDRGEYKVRLEGDTNYVMATYPQHDKFIITSPNVTELYIKSLLDKGIIHSKNLNDDYLGSKNLLKSRAVLRNAFSTYGKIDDSKSQYYPAYAPELGSYENSTGKSHIFLKPNLTTPKNLLWGQRYEVSGSTIRKTGKEDFFETETMTTMDALKFIEVILRVNEGDMTDTEAQIVSYKYGANYIDTLSGSDRSTVMYLTAKGILDFENFEEYSFLYEPFQKEFGFVLLYRVANSAARKNFSEIQLTDSDNFWIGKGYGNFKQTVKTPDISAIQSYKDSDGYLTVAPTNTSGKRLDEKNLLSLIPSVENARVIIEKDEESTIAYAKEQLDTLLRSRLNGDLSADIEKEYSDLSAMIQSDHASIMETSFLKDGTEVLHEAGLDINKLSGEDLYEQRDTAPDPSQDVSQKKAEAVSDRQNRSIVVEKLFDDPYKYLYDKKSIISGNIPSTKEERKKQKQLKSDMCSEDIVDVSYNSVCDQYLVQFRVTAVDAAAALQLVNSKIEVVSDSLLKESKINAVSKVIEDGEQIILVGKDSLSIIDPELQAVSDKVLINRRTGTKAIILTEQNTALVGNEVISAGEDALMVTTSGGQVYYNLKIISSLLTNTFLSSTSSKDFYSCYDIQPETYKDVYSERGDKISTAITGKYTYTSSQGTGDTTVPLTPVRVVKNFINISQLSVGSNTLIKEITETTSEGIKVTFKVVVEWELKLPDSSMEIQKEWTAADLNPTMQTINEFYYTRPSDDMKEIQDYWDNNIGISNALANVLYGTNGRKYITCGYLVPNITFLFYVDDNFTEGGSSGENLLQQGVVVSVAGKWFQKVGKELPEEWVKHFIGAPDIYNKIITSPSSSGVDSFTQYSKSLTDQGTGYKIKANEGSKYYSDKIINYSWFPAWVHISFNNQESLADYNTMTAANGREWRKLTSNRFFSYSARSERRSDGTLFGGKTIDSVAWFLMPSGALYKSMDRSTFRPNQDGSITAQTRNKSTDFGLLTGKTLEFDGKKYYVARVDEQYIELVSLDSLEGSYDGKKFVSDGISIEEAGYQILKTRFAGTDGSTTYSDRSSTVDAFQSATNKLPDTFYEADKAYLITDSSGGFVVKKFKSSLNGDGIIMETQDVKATDYKSSAIFYHPVIRLSVLGWDVTGEQNDTLVYRRTLLAFLFSDLYPAGLSKTVTDTLISKSIETVALEDLPEGSLVLFGDIYLYKTGESFATVPIAITSTKSVPRIVQGMAVESDLTRLVARILNMPVDSSGRVETIVNYINKVSLAPRINHEKFLYTQTLIAEGENLYEPYLANASQTTQAAENIDLIHSVSYLVTFDKGLVCMPVDTEAKTYTLLFTSVESGKNKVLNSPYFSGAMDFSIQNTINLEAFSSAFHALPNQHELKEQFKFETEEQAKRDMKDWVQSALCFILAYLMIMCVLMWFALRLTTFAVILNKIKHPANGEKGIDFVKIITFGIMEIDDEVSGVRLFTSMMVLCLLFAVILLL